MTTVTMIILLMINIVLTALNVTVFYLTTKARRARREFKIGGVLIRPQSKTAKEAPHLYQQGPV